jgi:hypothetical protein
MLKIFNMNFQHELCTENSMRIFGDGYFETRSVVSNASKALPYSMLIGGSGGVLELYL